MCAKKFDLSIFHTFCIVESLKRTGCEHTKYSNGHICLLLDSIERLSVPIFDRIELFQKTSNKRGNNWNFFILYYKNVFVVTLMS